MARIDQRGIDNQHSDFVSAAKAARMLDVKPETLYAYVSRGLLRSVAKPGSRARLYLLVDLQRLKARSDARRGHTAVAASALAWGAPIMDSAITRIDGQGPHYRGHSALELARSGTSFELVAELLWTSALPKVAPAVPGDAEDPRMRARMAALVPADASLLSVLTLAVVAAGLVDGDRHIVRAEGDLVRARALLRVMARGLSLGCGPSAGGARVAFEPEDRIAQLVCRALLRPPREAAARLVDQLLITSADHELNVSTFAVRVTASGGADLYACVSTGLSAMSGAWHGGMCDRVEALLQRCVRPAQAKAFVREHARLGEHIPGFGHPLYPQGDPRAVLLIAEARKLAPRNQRLLTLCAIADAMADMGRPDITLDLGLVAATTALALPAGSARALFALGRTAGWVAHMLEQREHKGLLRPRARYVGRDAGREVTDAS